MCAQYILLSNYLLVMNKSLLVSFIYLPSIFPGGKTLRRSSQTSVSLETISISYWGSLEIYNLCSGFLVCPGVSNQWHMPGTALVEASLVMCLKLLKWLPSIRRSSGSSQRLLGIANLLTRSWQVSPSTCTGISFLPLVLATFYFKLSK